jgi:hypothetical protein
MSDFNIEMEIDSRQQNIKLYEINNVIILGVGGIGSWVAFNIALTGKVNNIYIVDPDFITATNLNRTPFRLCDIGQPKVDALKYLILERRPCNVATYQCKTSKKLVTEIRTKLNIPNWNDSARMDANGVIIDCRDDVFDDFYELPYKYYKIGYDGLSITIDGNPRNTAVWGRANTYRFTPSFICPSQLAANLVVTDILTIKMSEEDRKDQPEYDTTTNTDSFDLSGRLNKVFTMDSKDIIEILYRETIKNEE